MPTVSWVAGTNPTRVSASSVSANSPAGLADGDVLVAFVYVASNTTCSPPAGWTEITNVSAANPGGTIKLFAFYKDTVTSANSSTSYTFTAGASATLELQYAAARIDSGVLQVLSSATNTQSNHNPNGAVTVVPPARTATADGQMVLTAGAYGYQGQPTYGPGQFYSAPSGMTAWTSEFSINTFSAGARQSRNSGQAVSTGSFSWAADLFDAIGSTTGISLLLGVVDNERTLADGVVFTDLTGQGQTYLDTVTGGVDFTDIPSQQWDDALTQAMIVRVPEGGVAAYPRWSRVAQDTLTGADVASVYPRWGAALSEAVVVAEALASAGKFATVATDTVRLADALRRAMVVRAADTVTFTRTLAVLQATSVVERLALRPAATGSTKRIRTILDTIALSDDLARFFSAVAEDAMALAGVAGAIRRTQATTTEAVALADALGHVAVFKVTVPESVEFDDALLLRALFSPVVDERVEISAAYIQPNGAVTTWAVNTRTSATTEYTGYEFRSFTRTGRRYLAAGRDGLYVLDGDTDDGEDIIADLKSGFAQFAGSRFTTIRAAYIGLRGTGEFLFRIIDGAGVTRDYKALVQDMRTAKVNTGRGIRTRYVAFELVSTGQDFTLDTVEMIPVLATRRV